MSVLSLWDKARSQPRRSVDDVLSTHSALAPPMESPTDPVVRDVRVRAAVVVVAGLAVGFLTFFGQGHLDGALNAFVNSASAWLVAPFAVGALMATPRGAAAAGATTCALQLVGYYINAHLHGLATGNAILIFWGLCAVVGGPVFGAAGHMWRNAPERLRGLGPAILAGAFVAEGLWSYLHVLHYYSTATLWISIGAGIAVLSTRGRLRDLRWLLLAVPAGLLGEVVLSVVYKQSF
jgi:hypothetical protein